MLEVQNITVTLAPTGGKKHWIDMMSSNKLFIGFIDFFHNLRHIYLVQ